jgi:hypothetical protein
MKYRKKSIWVLALALVLMLFQASYATTPTVVKRTSSKAASVANSTVSLNTASQLAQLKSTLAKHTKNHIAFFQSFTIGENQIAAFAVVGGDVWYITALDAQKLKSAVYLQTDSQANAPVLWIVDGTVIFKCEDVPGGSSSKSYAWYVKNGKPIELPYIGMRLSYIGNGQFTTMGEDFDSSFTDGVGAGHTYKRYYLYWTSNGLKEYGGLKITQQQLLKADGAKEIIKAIIKSGHTIDEIYYRANDIININYHSGNKQNGNFDNLTLKYKNDTVTPQLVDTEASSAKTENLTESNLSDFSYGGIYKRALYKNIAIYPIKFGL